MRTNRMGSAPGFLSTEFASNSENRESNIHANELISRGSFEYSQESSPTSAPSFILGPQRWPCDHPCFSVLREHGVRAMFH